MPKKTAYVLAEIGWEYNDEYNYRPEYGGSNAQAVYMDKDDAVAECERLNCIGIRGVDLSNYGGDGLSGILKSGVSEGVFVKWANETLGTKWAPDDCEFDIPDGLKHAQYKDLLNRISISFWEVLEVEVR